MATRRSPPSTYAGLMLNGISGNNTRDVIISHFGRANYD